MRTALELITDFPLLLTDTGPRALGGGRQYHGLESRRVEAQQSLVNWEGGVWRFVLECASCHQAAEYYQGVHYDGVLCGCPPFDIEKDDPAVPRVIDHWIYEEEPPVTGKLVFDEDEEVPE